MIFGRKINTMQKKVKRPPFKRVVVLNRGIFAKDVAPKKAARQVTFEEVTAADEARKRVINEFKLAEASLKMIDGKEDAEAQIRRIIIKHAKESLDISHLPTKVLAAITDELNKYTDERDRVKSKAEHGDEKDAMF